MDERVCVYVGIGSNLEDSFQHVSAAVQELGAVAHAGQVHRSALYRSAPMGPAEQPDYLNAAVRFETVLAPLVLLDALQAIEGDHGRVRGERWGARTLDLDLLLYGSRVIEHPRLRVPHPGLADRLFVVRPLEDLDPGATVPGLGTVGDIARTCPTWDMERVPWPAVGA
jgi:2-amino-4-hydroxy-6-hydroxymethyldihydropteridine diphosphokinase